MCKTRILFFLKKINFSKKLFDVFLTSPRIEIDPRESVSRFPGNHENLKIMEISEKSGFSKNAFEVLPTSPRIEIEPRESISRFPENHKKLTFSKNFRKNLIF